MYLCTAGGGLLALFVSHRRWHPAQVSSMRRGVFPSTCPVDWSSELVAHPLRARAGLDGSSGAAH